MAHSIFLLVHEKGLIKPKYHDYIFRYNILLSCIHEKKGFQGTTKTLIFAISCSLELQFPMVSRVELLVDCVASAFRMGGVRITI